MISPDEVEEGPNVVSQLARKVCHHIWEALDVENIV